MTELTNNARRDWEEFESSHRVAEISFTFARDLNSNPDLPSPSTQKDCCNCDKRRRIGGVLWALMDALEAYVKAKSEPHNRRRETYGEAVSKTGSSGEGWSRPRRARA
ncbi:hypothetical protein Nepgr_004647 [Nepenthes gracilis]|uniref:Uncharacterized protein n=1 Tax=Nepenthes gracilis TaxID=150966 RepID=A0AAD3S1R1_NEPGR|nr:hypothetical protein Nepgr_004647 [Nepenthes gracilis]